MPMTYDFVIKVMASDSSAYGLLGAVKTKTWPEDMDIKDILHLIRDNLKNIDVPTGFDSWLFINNQDNTVVGDGGFRGAPDENGVIELGYAIIAAQRKKGFGFEAASALLEWGLVQDGVNTVTADCLDNNVPSIKILSKLGMKETERKDGMIFYHITNPVL